MSKYEYDASKATIGVLSYIKTPKPSQVNDIDTFRIEKDGSLQAVTPAKAPAKIDRKKLIEERLRQLRGNKPDVDLMPYPEVGTEYGVDSFNQTKTAAVKSSILSDDEVNPIKLMIDLNERWSKDWIDWEPETILQTAAKENLELSRVNQDKIMALKVLIKTHEFFDSWRVFEKVCICFSNRIVDWSHAQPIKLAEAAATVVLVTRFIQDLDFSDDVKSYIAAIAIKDGCLILPESLHFANGEFAEELAMNAGDEAIEKQKVLLKKIETEDKKLTEEEIIQVIRLTRTQQYISELFKEL